MKSVLIIIAARDFNETEFFSVKDFLERNGVRVFIASDASGLCVGDKGSKIKHDVSFSNMKSANFDAVAIIGGNGILNYTENNKLKKVIRNFVDESKPVGAICNAPAVLAKVGVLKGKNATAYKEARGIIESEGGVFTESPVVVAENIVTAKDPDAALEFIETLFYLLEK